MAKAPIGSVIQQCIDAVNSLEENQRQNAINAVAIALGLETPTTSDLSSERHTGKGESPNKSRGDRPAETPKDFFESKDPQNKGEMLAVAGRWLELSEQTEAHTKEDFARVFREARRNFDANHFSRDIQNAQRQAGLFNTGGARGTYQLSYYGQQFIDALPDREATKSIRRPRKKVAKKAVKRQSKKKSAGNK